MLQVASHKGQITVAAAAHYEIPPGTYTPAELEEIHGRAIRSMLDQARFTGREAVIALPWDQLHLRSVRIPSMPEDEIAQAVRFEAAERFNLEQDRAEVRHIVAADIRQGTELRQEVIVLAAQRSVIDAHVNLLERVGLRPAAIDPAPCALFRGFERFLRRGEDRNEANVFVDLGYSGTRVAVSRGPELIFLKSIPIGGRRFDELVAESLAFSSYDAVQLRSRLRRRLPAALEGQADEDSSPGPVDETVRRSVLDAIRPALDQLSKEIALCVRYCSVTFRGPRADAVTVVGGEADDADILQVLSDQVNIPFHTGRPMRGIAFETDAGVADRRTGQPEWTTALGLALKPVKAQTAPASPQETAVEVPV
jgi:type IV pilus assembly protein PilM